MGADCIFCRITKKEIPSGVVYEDDDIFAFRDIKPQAPVHIIAIPRKHIASMDRLDKADEALLGKLLLKIMDIARSEGISESGYRVVINCNKNAGQEVFHLHVHLMGGRVFGWPAG